MSNDRQADTRVERAAILATERSILEHTDLITAQPAVDFGIDLLAFRPKPFAVAPIQVKGKQSGLTVWRKHAEWPLLVVYVLDPLGEYPLVAIMTGEDAWRLPFEYGERGGRATDHDAENVSYRWPSMTKRLRALVTERAATPERWEQLFEKVRAR
jgi:hypothetical protein